MKLACSFLLMPLRCCLCCWAFLVGRPRRFLRPLLPWRLRRFLIARTPVQEELVDVLDDVKDTQLMLHLSPVALQSVLVERRAVGDDHLGIESAIFEGL